MAGGPRQRVGNEIFKKVVQGIFPSSGFVSFDLFPFLGLQGFPFKLPEFSPVRVLRQPGLAGEIVQRELLFEVMAYPAFLCETKYLPFVLQHLGFHMRFGGKIPVDVATLTIFNDDPVVFPCRKIAIESSPSSARWSARRK